MIKIIFILILLLFLVLLLRALFTKTNKTSFQMSTDINRVETYSQKLSQMVQCETISNRDNPDIEKFRKFHNLLQTLFPSVFAHCEKTDLNGNLILKWNGKTETDPILIMSHMDVVEADGEWKYPCFSGKVADGKVWGRGSADTKCSLMAFLQAAEEMIDDGFVPECDVYLVSSCTEEIGGDGGPTICNWLKEKGVRLYMLCDEGGSIIKDPIANVKGYFAAVGIFEKGYGDIKFTARSDGGHASAPKKNTPIVRLSKFVSHVEKKYPFKSKFSPAVEQMFKTLSHYSPFGLRLVFSNLWLFKPLLKLVMPKISSQAAAMLRTTIAFTMQSGSNGYNVIPEKATLCANMRFIPHQSTDESIKIITDLAKKYDIETEVIYRGYPSKSLDLNGRPYAIVKESINKIFKNVGVMPYVVTGATDARFYGDVCDNCVRFSPVLYDSQQLSAIHGIDENIDCGCLPMAVDFYKEIILFQNNR